MSNQPQTSVIIPVFNGERFILDAIHSVLSQLSLDDELLIIDDSSTDKTKSILTLPDPRVKVFFGKGSGPSAARNIGIGAARGKFIAFLDHDDLWPKDRHRILLRALLANDCFEAAHGRIIIQEEDVGAAKKYEQLHGTYAPWCIFTSLYRSSLIKKGKFFNEDMWFGEDIDFNFQLEEAGMKTIQCDHDSLIIRRHLTNATNNEPHYKKTILELAFRKIIRKRKE